MPGLDELFRLSDGLGLVLSFGYFLLPSAAFFAAVSERWLLSSLSRKSKFFRFGTRFIKLSGL